MFPHATVIRYARCMEPSREDIRAWITQVLARSGESATALARRAGIAQSTLTRFLNDPDAPMLGLRSITKIAAATGEHPIFGVTSAAPRSPPISEGVASRYTPEPGSTIAGAIEALTMGRNAADVWELGELSGLEAAGYLPGDVVIVDRAERPEAGDLVCALDYRRGSAATPVTVFRFYDPPYLTTPSRDEHLRKPLLVDNEHVSISGPVIGSLRPRR